MLVICYLFCVCVCRLKAQQSLCLYIVLTMPTLNKTYLFISYYRMVGGFTTTYAISAYYHLSCEFESRSWRCVLDTTLCDKFVRDLRQFGCFQRVFRFPPPIKLTATI